MTTWRHGFVLTNWKVSLVQLVWSLFSKYMYTGCQIPAYFSHVSPETDKHQFVWWFFFWFVCFVDNRGSKMGQHRKKSTIVNQQVDQESNFPRSDKLHYFLLFFNFENDRKNKHFFVCSVDLLQGYELISVFFILISLLPWWNLRPRL